MSEKGPMGPICFEDEEKAVAYMLKSIRRYRDGEKAYRDSDGNKWFGLEYWDLIELERVLMTYEELLSQPISKLIDWKRVKANSEAKILEILNK